MWLGPSRSCTTGGSAGTAGGGHSELSVTPPARLCPCTGFGERGWRQPGCCGWVALPLRTSGPTFPQGNRLPGNAVSTDSQPWQLPVEAKGWKAEHRVQRSRCKERGGETPGQRGRGGQSNRNRGERGRKDWHCQKHMDSAPSPPSHPQHLANAAPCILRSRYFHS